MLNSHRSLSRGSTDISTPDVWREDYCNENYTNPDNKLIWDKVCTGTSINHIRGECMRCQYTSTGASNPGFWLYLDVRPGYYCVEFDARILSNSDEEPQNAFIYVNATYGKKRHTILGPYTEKNIEILKIPKTEFGKVKGSFHLPFNTQRCSNSYSYRDKREGCVHIQFGILFCDAVSLIHHDLIEVRSVCIMDLGLCRQINSMAKELFDVQETKIRELEVNTERVMEEYRTVSEHLQDTLNNLTDIIRLKDNEIGQLGDIVENLDNRVEHLENIVNQLLQMLFHRNNVHGTSGNIGGNISGLLENRK